MWFGRSLTMSRFLLWLLLWPPLALGDEPRPGFDILEYAVTGNSVLAALAIEQAVYPYLGEGKTIADVEAARSALEKAYHEAGYLTVFVNIPEQQVEGGTVRLEVVQGEVERLRVKGSRYYSLGHIKARVPELAEGNVPYFPEVQKQLAGLGRSADRKVTPVLRPGRQPGKLEVELKVEDTAPLHGTVDLNDRYSADTSRTRLSGSVRWDNLWQREHSIGVLYQVAPERPADSRAASLTYSVPMESGDFLAAYVVRNDSDVATLGTLGVIGKGEIVGLRYVLPLRARSLTYHSLTFGVDYKDLDQAVRIPDAGSVDTPVAYLPFTLSWDGTWAAENSSTRVGLSANFHIRDLVGDDTRFGEKRFKASSGYIYLRGNAEHNWRAASGMAVTVRSGFQLADAPLISSEQYAIGGVDSVRGYLEPEVLGDRGISGGLELRSAHLHPPWSEQVERLFSIAFIEGGYVKISSPLPGQKQSLGLAGTGFGLRLEGWKGVKLAMDLAWPLRDGARTQAGDERLHFSLGYAF